MPAQEGFRQPDPKGHPDLFVWTDTCNVYVLRDGDAALLIDLGDGSVLDHLKEIGIRTVEWVLFTQHHREQTQGAPRLEGRNVKVGGPQAERNVFENPIHYRRMKVRLKDPYTVHGSSYVRPPRTPVRFDRAFGRWETFTWRKYTLRCVNTPGNSPGAMSYLLKEGGDWLAFTGDLMLAGATMHTWYDTEWDYGFASGIYAIAGSAGHVRGFRPRWLLPSQGPAVEDAAPVLAEYLKKLRNLDRLLVRGYDVHRFSHAVQDKVSKPTAVPNVWAVSPHLFKFRAPRFGANMSIILSRSGRALAVDCGLFDVKFLDDRIARMKTHLGLKSIDAVVITHMHGDHFLQAPHLRKKYGTEIWAIDRMKDVCERPERFDYAAPIQAYGHGIDGVKFDRYFKDGESFTWEEYEFTVDWMPGQTEFALALQGMIDGRKVVFTGDNLFGDPEDPTHTAHEAVVAHNSAILEEGYIYGAEYLSRLKPDLVMGAHCFVMDKPAGLIERFRKWSYEMRDAFKALNAEEDYRIMFDPFWVRAEPYRLALKRGAEAQVTLHLRNFLERKRSYRIEVRGEGVRAEPAEVATALGAEERKAVPLKLTASADAPPGVRIVTFETTVDGRRYGERFDMIVEIKP